MGNVDDYDDASFKPLLPMSLMFKSFSMACNMSPENTSGMPFKIFKLYLFRLTTTKLFVMMLSFDIFLLILEDY